MTGKRKGLSSDELQAARDDADLQASRDDAKRRIAVRDERAARRAAHEERVGPLRENIKAAIGKLNAAFLAPKMGNPHPDEPQVSDALITALLGCNPLPEDDADDEDDACAPGWAPTPALGPPTLLELQALLQSALRALQTVRAPQRRAGYEVVVEQRRALCDAARATGPVDESALAECDPRIVEALKREAPIVPSRMHGARHRRAELGAAFSSAWIGGQRRRRSVSTVLVHRA